MGNKKRSTTLLGYVIVPSLLIIIIAIIANVFAYRQEFNFYQNVYNNEIASTASLINRRFQSALTAAESIRAFFVGSNSVESQEFDAFGAVLTKSLGPSVITMPVTVEWIDDKNNIRYVYPMNEDNAKIISTDLNQYPNRLIPITKARETRLPVVTEPIMLGQGYPGLLLYSPIFKGGVYMGESVVVIRLANLFAPIPGQNQIYSKNEYIQTGNFIMPFDDDMIFNENGERISDPKGDLVKDPIAKEYASSVKGVITQDITFADKTWQLKFSPTYIAEVNKRMEFYIIISFLFVSGFIIFLWILHRGREQLVKEQAKTEAVILSVGDGLTKME